MSSINVLIVDDSKTNLIIVKDILQEEYFNYIFSTATSGEKALEMIKEKDFDLILLDIVMPKMSGFDVCKILKNDNRTKNIPIIFLTAADDQNQMKEAFELGAVDYISKPFQSFELIARVGAHVKLFRALKQLKEYNKATDEAHAWESVMLKL